MRAQRPTDDAAADLMRETESRIDGYMRAWLADADFRASLHRFDRLSPDEIAVLPPGYSAPLPIRTTRELIAERLERRSQPLKPLA